jgi:peptidoglycan/xylan/chitin deacetylase (PgdA/CDA1 family)
MGPVLVCLLVLLLAPGLYLLLPYLLRRAEIRRLQARCSERGVLILTYDDGPCAGLTGELVELLGERGVRGTFFPCGASARAHPDLLDRVSRAGHEIGCHSEAHRDAWRVAPWTLLADIEDGYATLAPWVAPNGLFRPPYGRMNLVTMLAIALRRARRAWWTVDAGDTDEDLPAPERVVARVLRRRGGVVLLHDYHKSPERQRWVLETTERLIDMAQSARLSVVTLGELLSA